MKPEHRALTEELGKRLTALLPDGLRFVLIVADLDEHELQVSPSMSSTFPPMELLNTLLQVSCSVLRNLDAIAPGATIREDLDEGGGG